ncbi:RES domain-containing protein [Peribacillus frigoritolerans]|uniref:RES domain-containing protein n=1 Tax=Peribacillus frigoritolerans TaxID=450367 RepID=UPI0039A2530F
MDDSLPKCCERCFKDPYICKFIRSDNNIGKCSYCNSVQVYIIEIKSVGEFIKKGLRKKFKEVDFSDYPEYYRDIMDIGETAKNRVIAEKVFLNNNYEDLLNDLFVYSSPNYRDNSKGEEDFWDNGDVELDEIDVTEEYQYSSAVLDWELFKFTIKHNNRFFDIGNDRREDILKEIQCTIEKMTINLLPDTLIHRARLKPPEYNFPQEVTSLLKECGPPPVHLSKSLRMNPAGISYFYGSDDEKTSLIEIRAGFNDEFIIGSFKTRKELKLIDLTIDPQEQIPSIFSNEYNHDLYLNIMFIQEFANEISKPVSDTEAPLEYLPTQLFSEYLRKSGFNGICYKSSLTGAKNYTLFCGPIAEEYTEIPEFLYSDRSYIPTEFTEWLYLVEYKNGVINDIGYKSTNSPQKINKAENPIPFTQSAENNN